MKPRNLTICLFLSAALALGGCAPTAPAPPAAPPATAPAPAPAKPEPAKPEAPKPAPAPAPEKPKAPLKYVPVGDNLIFNPSFEKWDGDGSVDAWNLAEGMDATWEVLKGLRVGVEVAHGENAIELPKPGEGKTVILSQTVLPGKIQPKERLRVSAQAKAGAEGVLHLLLTYKQGGQEQVVRRIHSGSGAWETLQHEFWVPADADPASFRLQFIVKGAEGAPVQIDDVRVLHLKGVPADAPVAALPAKAPAPAEQKAANPDPVEKKDNAPAEKKTEPAKSEKKADAKSKSDADAKKK